MPITSRLGTPRRSRFRVTAVVLLAAAIAPVVWQPSEPRANGEVLVPLESSWQVNTFTTGFQGLPEVGMDASGNFTIGWSSAPVDSDSAQDGDDYGVFGQRFDELSSPIGTEWQINQFTTGGQIISSAEQIGFGGKLTFAVTWSDFQPDPSAADAFLQIYEDGVAESPDDLQVNTFTTGDQMPSDVFLTTDVGPVLRGGVCFEGTSQLGAATEVYCRTGIYGDDDPYSQAAVAPPKQLVGTEFQVNTYTTGYQGRPSACGLGNGEFVVAWADFGRDPLISDVFARRADVDGGPIGTEFQVNSDTLAYHDFPRICCSQDGFVVVWHNGPGPTPVDGSSHSVSARRFDAATQPLGDEFLVNQSTVGTQWLPSIACDSTGNFVVEWENTNPTDLGTYARAFGADGQPLTDETVITPTAATASIGMSDAGVVVFAWAEELDGGDDAEVVAQRFGVPGLVTTTTLPSSGVCGDPIDPSTLTAASGAADRVITASDALHALRTAVALTNCLLCVCDVNDSGSVTASDALTILREAVGIEATLSCPPCDA